MFEIKLSEDGVILSGRFDASQVESARQVFERIEEACIVDFEALSYISSGGLGLLLGTEKRLRDKGHQLTLRNLSCHIREVFQYAGLDMIFRIE
jgi:anti-anti-sigma factor